MPGGRVFVAGALCLASLLICPLPLRAQQPNLNEKTITLRELQELALRTNPTLAEAAAEIRAAEGRRKQSGLYPNPTAGYVGGEIRGGVSQGGQHGFFVQQDIVLGGKLGLNRRIFEQERNQAEVEADEQKLRVLSNVRLSYIQALAAQQTVELRRALNQLAQDAVQTSHQLANVGQADTPDVLESEVEAQLAELALAMAEQNQQRVWTELATVVGTPRLPLLRIEGTLEDSPEVDTDNLVERIVNDSPAVKIADLAIRKAEATLTRARREPIPNLQLRGGLQQNVEASSITGRATGLQGFAQIGVEIPIFNRNQGNVEASNANVKRARREAERIKLLLRERAASVVQRYKISHAAIQRYKNQMIPRARQAYEMYMNRYRGMAAAYPQVLIAQRTLIQIEVSYIAFLEDAATSFIILDSYLLMDGLEAPSRVGDLDRPVREVNMPFRASPNQ